jgi:hypothetical protein
MIKEQRIRTLDCKKNHLKVSSQFFFNLCSLILLYANHKHRRSQAG